MILLDHLLAIFLVVVGPLRSGVAFRRLGSAAPDELPRARASAYRSAALGQWLRVVAVGLVWWMTRRPLADLGLVPKFGAGFIGVIVGFAVIVALMLRQRGAALADPQGRAAIRAQLASTAPLLPHTRAEFGGFAWVAVTAGLCEELLYRGYLIWYFSHALPWWAAAIVASVVFGFGHLYQGTRGVIVTGLLGAFLAAVYFVTGSLYPAMLIHGLMDLHTGDMAWRVYAHEHEDLPPAGRVVPLAPVTEPPAGDEEPGGVA